MGGTGGAAATETSKPAEKPAAASTFDFNFDEQPAAEEYQQ